MKHIKIVSKNREPESEHGKAEKEEYGKMGFADLFAINEKKANGPTSFHMSRTANCNFRIMLDPPEIPLPESPTMKGKTPVQRGNLGTFPMKGKDVNVTSTDFYRFVFAASQMLHTTNYLSGDPSLEEKPEKPEKPKKGQTKEEIEKAELIRKEERMAKAEASAKGANKTIVFRLDDCAKLMYGTDKPSSEQRKRITTLIEFLHCHPVVIKNPRGNIRLSFLCTMQDIEVEYEKGTSGAKPTVYALNLNPIFVYEWATNFCELPRDIMERISKEAKKTTEAHLAMLALLSRQNRRAPFHRTMDQLTKDLGIAEEYANNKGRVEKKVLDVCEVFVKIKMLSGYHVTKRDERIERVSFFFSDKFIDRAPKKPTNSQEDSNAKEE